MFMADVFDDGAVEFLASPDRTSKLEEHDRIRSARDRLVAPQPHHARPLQRVVRLPVLLARRLLHQHERLAALQPAHQIVHHCRVAERRVERRIVVPGDDIQMLGPGEIVQLGIGAHQVRCDGDVRGMFFDRVIFQLVAFEQAVGLEPPVIERDALEVRPVAGPLLAQLVRRHDLVPIVERMAPEAGVPRPVDVFKRAVAPLQPFAERGFAPFAIAVAAVFVRDVPHDDGRMIFVPFGQLLGHKRGEFAVRRTVRTRIVTAAELAFAAMIVDAQHVRVFLRHPGGMRARAGRKARIDAVLVQPVDRRVQVIKIVRLLVRLVECPREDVQRRHINARQLEHADVFAPHVRIVPLLRIVVAAIPNLGELMAQHGAESSHNIRFDIIVNAIKFTLNIILWISDIRKRKYKDGADPCWCIGAL